MFHAMEIETGWFPAAAEVELERNSLGTCEIESPPFEEPPEKRRESPLEVVEITKEYDHLHLDDDRITSDSDSDSESESDTDDDDDDADMVSHCDEYNFGEPIRLERRGGYEWEEPLNGVIAPVSLEEYEEEFKQFVEFAIEKQGKTNKIVLERIVKENLQVLAPPCIYYITFEAKDMDDDDDHHHHYSGGGGGSGGLIKTYQTKVVLQFPEEDSYVKIFREKPAQC